MYRDAVEMKVRSKPGTVGRLLASPGVWSSVGLGDETHRPVVAPVGPDEFRAVSARGDVTLRFKMEACDDGTRLLVSADHRPTNAIETMAHMFFPQRKHQELTETVSRFCRLAESLDE